MSFLHVYVSAVEAAYELLPCVQTTCFRPCHLFPRGQRRRNDERMTAAGGSTGIWSCINLSSHLSLSIIFQFFFHRHLMYLFVIIPIDVIFLVLFFIFIFLIYLARLHSMWDLSSLARDWTHCTLHSKHKALTTGPTREFRWCSFKLQCFFFL